MTRRPLLTALAGLAALSACASSPRCCEAGYDPPFPAAAHYRLIQGNSGRFGHTGALAYAFDFALPLGSEVAAARAGQVVAVESRFADGTRKPGEENYVFVRHRDGTFGRYYHLRQGGVRVGVGDRVRRGQVIALSGNSGASAGPHLHFDVTTGCPEFGCQTVAITFHKLPAQLKDGEVY